MAVFYGGALVDGCGAADRAAPHHADRSNCGPYVVFDVAGRAGLTLLHPSSTSHLTLSTFLWNFVTGTPPNSSHKMCLR